MCVSSNWFHTHNRLYDRSRKREMRSLSGALGDFATRLRVYKVWIHGGVEWKATGVECATIGCGLCARGTLLHLIHPGASNGAFPRATPPLPFLFPHGTRTTDSPYTTGNDDNDDDGFSTFLITSTLNAYRVQFTSFVTWACRVHLVQVGLDA